MSHDGVGTEGLVLAFYVAVALLGGVMAVVEVVRRSKRGGGP